MWVGAPVWFGAPVWVGAPVWHLWGMATKFERTLIHFKFERTLIHFKFERTLIHFKFERTRTVWEARYWSICTMPKLRKLRRIEKY